MMWEKTDIGALRRRHKFNWEIVFRGGKLGLQINLKSPPVLIPAGTKNPGGSMCQG